MQASDVKGFVGLDEATRILRAEFDGRPDELIPMLQRVQNAVGYLPEEVLLEIARATRLPAARIFGVVTFYAQFRLRPVGKYIIRVCRGTACHVSGSSLILQDIQDHLKVLPGQTTDDGLFTLETVACFGSCALAPVVVVNDSVYGLMDPSKTRKLLGEIREKHAAIVAQTGAEKGEHSELRIYEG
jgi:NADH-quinone oxidoreductase subunit E